MTSAVVIRTLLSRCPRSAHAKLGHSYMQVHGKATRADVDGVMAMDSGVQSSQFDIPVPESSGHEYFNILPQSKKACGNCLSCGKVSCSGRKSSAAEAAAVAGKADVERTLQDIRTGKFENLPLPNPDHLEHFNKKNLPAPIPAAEVITYPDGPPPIGTDAMPHPIWSQAHVDSVEITHNPPEKTVDWMAFYAVQTLRTAFDVMSGYNRGVRTEGKWLRRIIFLETVAAVPGMVAGMTRHLHSLRRLQRDYGWIHTLLEEAENERMHLMTALQLRKPSRLFRLGIVGTQGLFVTVFSVSYLLSPRFCHRFVGYLEEEAVKTYTKCLKDIDEGALQHWQTRKSPDMAIRYWQLDEDASMRDVILAIRADEAHHRIVNHTFASMKPSDYNPYKPGQ